MKGIKIKDTPVNWQTIYKITKDTYANKFNEWSNQLYELEKKHSALFEDIKLDFVSNKDKYDESITNYEEFVNDVYIDGCFLKYAKGLYGTKKNDYESSSRLYDLYEFAMQQKDIHNLKKNISLAHKIANLALKEYNNIVSTFFNEVHKQMILEGCGYYLSPQIGWICINRVRLSHKRDEIVDYPATARKKKELIAAGKKPYDSNEAKWCEERGIPYDGVEYVVYRKNSEYIYEVPIISSYIKDVTKNLQSILIMTLILYVMQDLVFNIN